MTKNFISSSFSLLGKRQEKSGRMMRKNVGRFLFAVLVFSSLPSVAQTFRTIWYKNSSLSTPYAQDEDIWFFIDETRSVPLYQKFYGSPVMNAYSQSFSPSYPGYIYGSDVSSNSNVAQYYWNGRQGEPAYFTYVNIGTTIFTLTDRYNGRDYQHRLRFNVIATSLAYYKSKNSFQDVTKLKCSEGLIVTYKDKNQAYIQTRKWDKTAVGLHIVLKNEANRASFDKLKVGDVLYGELAGKLNRTSDWGVSGKDFGCWLDFKYYNERRVSDGNWLNAKADLHNQPVGFTKVSLRELYELSDVQGFKWGLDGCRVLLHDIKAASDSQLSNDGYVLPTGFKFVDVTNNLKNPDKTDVAPIMWSEQTDLMASQRVDMDVIAYPVWQSNNLSSSMRNYPKLSFHVPSQTNIWGKFVVRPYGYITFCLDQPFRLPTSATSDGLNGAKNNMIDYAATISAANKAGLTYSKVYQASGTTIVPKNQAVLIKVKDGYDYTASGNKAVFLFQFEKTAEQALPTSGSGNVNLLNWGKPGVKTSTGNATYDANCKFYHLAAQDPNDVSAGLNFYYGKESPNGEPFMIPSGNRTASFLAVPKSVVRGAKGFIALDEIDFIATDIAQVLSADASEIDAYYSLEGYKLSSPRKGINIVRLKNGKTYRILVR